MSAGALLLAALAALLAPAGLGLLALVPAALARAPRAALAGLLLLALAAWARERTTAPPSPSLGDSGAVRLVGRWRDPPGVEAHLQTTHGALGLQFPQDLFPPAPGTPVVVQARLGATGRLTVVKLTATGPPRGAWLDRWAVRARERVAALVSPGGRGLVEALVLGRRDDLPRDVVESCRASGTSHLLALSGLHVVLVARVLSALLRGLLGGQRRGLEALLLVLFVGLAGWRPPLARAALAFLLARGAEHWGRCLPPLHRLGAVALVLGTAMPAWVDDLGARLSFLAVGGLLAAGGLLPRPWGALLAPAGAFLATAPLVAETFGRLAPTGVLWTPLLVPLVGAVLALGLVLVVPGAALAGLDPWAGPLLDGAAHLLRLALLAAGQLSPAPLHPPPLPLPGTAAGVVVIAALAALAPAPRRPSLP